MKASMVRRLLSALSLVVLFPGGSEGQSNNVRRHLSFSFVRDGRSEQIAVDFDCRLLPRAVAEESPGAPDFLTLFAKTDDGGAIVLTGRPDDGSGLCEYDHSRLNANDKESNPPPLVFLDKLPRPDRLDYANSYGIRSNLIDTHGIELVDFENGTRKANDRRSDSWTIARRWDGDILGSSPRSGGAQRYFTPEAVEPDFAIRENPESNLDRLHPLAAKLISTHRDQVIPICEVYKYDDLEAILARIYAPACPAAATIHVQAGQRVSNDYTAPRPLTMNAQGEWVAAYPSSSDWSASRVGGRYCSQARPAATVAHLWQACVPSIIVQNADGGTVTVRYSKPFAFWNASTNSLWIFIPTARIRYLDDLISPKR